MATVLSEMLIVVHPSSRLRPKLVAIKVNSRHLVQVISRASGMRGRVFLAAGGPGKDVAVAHEFAIVAGFHRLEREVQEGGGGVGRARGAADVPPHGGGGGIHHPGTGGGEQDAACGVDIADLRGQRWIAGPGDEQAMGVWPGLDERPEIAHTARDWLAKLRLVAAGCGIITTPATPATLAAAAPAGARILPVRGGPAEQRRILLARLPRPLPEPVARLTAALRAAAIETDAPA
jgi:hypothetical protein